MQGGSEMLFARNEYVRIMAIDGASSIGEWRGGSLRAAVLPGERVFSVSRQTQSTSGGLLGLLAQLDQGSLLVNLTFPVEAGHRYVIEFASDGSGTYVVSRQPMQGADIPHIALCAPRKPFDYLHLVCSFS